MKRIVVTATQTIVSALVLAACAAGSGPGPVATSEPPHSTTGQPTVQPVSAEPPVPAESNPPGDIPDSIAFVPYTDKAGAVTVSTPEGWARTSTGSGVSFTDKLNTVQVAWTSAAEAPTVGRAKAVDVPALSASTRAFKLVSVTATSLPAGPAVLITYQANSDPNPVTGKQYRLVVLRYELFHARRQVNLILLSPVGADNVDPWRIVTQSLAWS
jgi:hypothetical protein